MILSLKTPATHYTIFQSIVKHLRAHLYYKILKFENMNTIINLIEKPTISSGVTGFICRFLAEQPSTCRLVLLVPTGIFCTIWTRFLQIRMLLTCCARALKKAETGQGGSLRTPGTDRVNCDPRRYGNLVGICRSRRRRRCVVLDGYRAARFGNRFHRGDLSPASQTAGSALRRYRGGPAYYIHDWITTNARNRNAGFEENLRTVCALRSDSLVRYQQVISNSVTL